MLEDRGARLLAKVAQLYHLQGLNQNQIGRRLGMSRSKVSRMLKEARERGLVEISIHAPARFALELERQLEAALGLREAVVVNASGDLGSQPAGVRGEGAHGAGAHAAGAHGAGAHAAGAHAAGAHAAGAHAAGALGVVAGAAADYLLRLLQPGDVLGVSGGRTVALTAQVMQPNAVEGVSVAQLGAAVPTLGEGMAYSSAEVALQLAQKIGGMDRLALIPVPSLLDTETIRDALLLDTGVQQALALLASCTIALVGIGTLASLALASAAPGVQRSGRHYRRRLLPVSDEEIAELRSAGAVGEICARFYDLAGRPCSASLDRRMVGLSLEQVRTAPLVIGVAAGPEKAAAIVGAARGGYVKSLVTDDLTAMAVLELVRTNSSTKAATEEVVGAPADRPPHQDATNQTAVPASQAPWPRPRTALPRSNHPVPERQQTSGPAQLAHS